MPVAPSERRTEDHSGQVKEEGEDDDGGERVLHGFRRVELKSKGKGVRKVREKVKKKEIKE